MWRDHRRLILLGGAAVVLAVAYLVLHRPFGLGGDEQARAAVEEEDAPSATPDPAPEGPARRGGTKAVAPPTANYAHVLRLSRNPGPDALPGLKRAATDPSWEKRQAGVIGIGRLKQKGDPAFLLQVLANGEEQPEVRAAAAEALGAMRHYEAGPALIQAMDDAPQVVRAAAGVALYSIMRTHYGYRAGDTPDRRRQVLGLIRADWPKCYAFLKGQER